MNDIVFLDTETSGGGKKDVIIEITIMDINEHPLINTLVYSDVPINYHSGRVHGISLFSLIDAPSYPEIHSEIKEATKNKTVIAYNSSFDRRLLQQTIEKYNLEHLTCNWQCFMLEMQRLKGENKSLQHWCEKYGISVPSHRSLDDTRSLVRLYKEICQNKKN